MPAHLHVPLPGPFSYSVPLGGVSRTGSLAATVTKWLLLSPFLLAWWAIVAAIWLVFGALAVVVFVWTFVFRLITAKTSETSEPAKPA
ncbi:hypothetical protein [Amycolatopsis anabasis]|uniref:hypothetical protein n=1 Tax=Amycolatopsis anabasis TaxID=1840409 RepID=UPI00131D1749|nr:hypothetical protein [Amycolatopsis anabasis]